MSWIEEVPYDKAEGTLKKLYNRVKGPDNNIDNILSAHSLRPHSLHGHMTLYKNVLHHRNNTLPKWYLETLGVYVSLLNHCHYCIDHHFAGLQKLVGIEEAARLLDGLKRTPVSEILEKKLQLGLSYAQTLTLHPEKMEVSQLHLLREQGLDDGQILEINQVVSYFNYANRMVLGLGVNTDGDILGLSPNDNADEQNWQHS